MKTFIIKIGIYCVVILGILYAFPLSIYFISKDNMSLVDMIETQRKHPQSLIGFSYFGSQTVKHKSLLLTNTTPDIFVFGSSRTFQITRPMFKEQYAFVNIAVPRPSIGNFINVQDLIKQIPDDGKPRTLLLLLDKRFFTERYDESSDKNGDSFLLKFMHLIGKPLRLVYLDYAAHKYSFTDLVYKSRTTHNIGLWSLVKDSGYRIDGSFREGYEMSNPERRSKLTGEIAGRVYEIDHYNQKLLLQEQENIVKNLEDANTVLRLCQDKGITVVAFVAPDPIAVSHAIANSTSTYAQTQRALEQSIESMVTAHGFTFFNLSDITKYGGKDEEFLDLIHGGDLVYGKAIVYMASHNAHFRNYVDVYKLQKIIKETQGDFIGF